MKWSRPFGIGLRQPLSLLDGHLNDHISLVLSAKYENQSRDVLQRASPTWEYGQHEEAGHDRNDQANADADHWFAGQLQLTKADTG